MAVDPEYAQVYWTDRKAGRIQRLTLKCPAGVLEAPTPFGAPYAALQPRQERSKAKTLCWQVASRMNSSNIKATQTRAC